MGLSMAKTFADVIYWIEKSWRYKAITKDFDDYKVSKVGHVLTFESTEKTKLYKMILGDDFLRLEFIVAFSKVKEFYNEVMSLNNVLKGYLTPLMIDISKLAQVGKINPSQNGVFKGVYYIVKSEKALATTNAVIKTPQGEENYGEVRPLPVEFIGYRILEEGVAQSDDISHWKLLSKEKLEKIRNIIRI